MRPGLKPNKNCEKCGTPFYAAPSHVAKGWGKYCSLACSAKPGEKNGRWKESNTSCRNCGKIFHVPPAKHAAGAARRYCSDECRLSVRNATIVCPTCSREFSVPASHALRRKFCSSECMKKSRKNSTPNRVCVTCNKPFYVKESDLRRGRNIGTFCSDKCMTGGRGKTVLEDGKAASHLERELFLVLQAEGLLAGAVREFRFHPVRKWRFDFAWPEIKVAVEVQGGIWLGGKGAHTSGKGRERDSEKLCEAAILGWVVLEVAPNQIKSGQALRWIKSALDRWALERRALPFDVGS